MKRLQTLFTDYAPKSPDLALVNLLNQAPDTFVRDLVSDAKSVVSVLGSFQTLRALMTAQRQGKVPKDFWKAYDSLNETLGDFIHAPRVDTNFFYEGEPVFWSLKTEESPIALRANEVRLVLRLLELGTLDRVRQCQQCDRWYKALRSDQRFCSAKCRWHAFASNPKFKEERRKYAKHLYRQEVNRNVVKRRGK